MKTKVAISLDCTELDSAIEKANRLVELLREAQQIAALVRPIQERQKVGLGDIELNTTGFFGDSEAGHTPELLQQQQLQQRK